MKNFEEISKNIGTILAPDSTKNKLTSALNRKQRIVDTQRLIWKKRVELDNQAYYDSLYNFSQDVVGALAEINKEAECILGILKKLNPGTSSHDADLLANAKWFRLNTECEPLVISDDRDLLTCGHLISSFFGLALGLLSAFEILRIMGSSEQLSKYCHHYSLNENLNSINSPWSKEDLEKELSNILKKGKIACHPSPQGCNLTPLKRIMRLRHIKKPKS